MNTSGFCRVWGRTAGQIRINSLCLPPVRLGDFERATKCSGGDPRGSAALENAAGPLSAPPPHPPAAAFLQLPACGGKLPVAARTLSATAQQNSDVSRRKFCIKYPKITCGTKADMLKLRCETNLNNFHVSTRVFYFGKNTGSVFYTRIA